MKTVREFLSTALVAGIVLAIILTISRPILIPPGANDVVNVGWGWREFSYKDARYIQSPLGHMSVVYDDATSFNEIIDAVKKSIK